MLHQEPPVPMRRIKKVLDKHREGDRLVGFWHTGYMEFHEPVGLGELLASPSAPEFRCEQCGESFPTFDQLRSHRFEKHPAVRPVLFVRGREVGGSPLRVTRSIKATDVRTLHTSAARLNGRPVPLDELGHLLANMSSTVADVQLAGDIVADFRLVFEIALDRDIAGVERCFENAAHRGRLDRRAIEDFIEAARAFPTALAYCDGICEYFYGVLAKERSPESSLPFHEYREKFNRAADVLRDIDRPLARLIQGLVAFHFNHFPVASLCSPSTRIAAASSRYTGWILASSDIDAGTAGSNTVSVDRLLTDLDTERILRWVLAPSEDTLSHSVEIEAAINRDIPEFDRVKLRVLLAEVYQTSGRITDAQRHARELRNNPTLGPWAESVLTVQT